MTQITGASVALVILLLRSVGDLEVPPELKWLQENCITFSVNDETHIANCKAKVRAMLESVDGDKSQMASLGASFVEAIGQSEEFRLYDYYLLWLGRGILDQLEEGDARKLVSPLIAKIERRYDVQMQDDVREEVCGVSIEQLQIITGCPTPVMRDESGHKKIDWSKWREMRDWIEKQRT